MTVQETLNLILQKQNELQLQFSALVITLLLFMVGIATYLNDFKNRHTIPNLAKTSYQLALKKLDRLKIKKNLGEKGNHTPDALPQLEKFVAEYWLATDPRIMEFTESVWLPIIRNGNFTRPDWKPLTERWKSFGFIVQKDPNARTGKGTALVVNKNRITGMERKLRLIASTSPAPSLNTIKAEETAG